MVAVKSKKVSVKGVRTVVKSPKELNKCIKSLREATSESGVENAITALTGWTMCRRAGSKIDGYVNRAVIECKYNVDMESSERNQVLAQSLVYCHDILHGENKADYEVPSLIALVDKDEAMVIEFTEELAAFVGRSDLDWTATKPSDRKCPKMIAIAQACADLEINARLFDLTNKEDLSLFVDAIDNNNLEGAKRLITQHNVATLYAEWTELMRGRLYTAKNCEEPVDVNLLPGYFICDINNEAVVPESKKGHIVFESMGGHCNVDVDKYKAFWSRIHRPPKGDALTAIVQQFDQFRETFARLRQGAFFTPPWLAQKAVEYMDRAFPGWQDDPNTYVWDMAAGTGNLLDPIKDKSRVFASDVDVASVLAMRNQFQDSGMEMFVFDFLNGSLPQLPRRLRDIIEDKSKRVIVFINPPFGEATAGIGEGANKTGVSTTDVKRQMLDCDLGASANELVTQFLYRVRQWLPSSPICFFATPKFLVAEASEKFREQHWRMQMSEGLITSSKVFGLSGAFPISFSCWEPGGKLKSRFTFDVYNANGESDGKYQCGPANMYLADWIDRPKGEKVIVPLIGPVSRRDATTARLIRGSGDQLGYIYLQADMAHQQTAQLLSSVYHGGNGFSLTSDNFLKGMVSLAAVHVVKNNWLNNREVFQIPACDHANPKGVTNLPSDFITDAIIWILLHGQNNSASAKLPPVESRPCSKPDADVRRALDAREVIIDNQFYPFSTKDVAKWADGHQRIVNAAEKAEETFTHQWIKHRELSEEAKAVLSAARAVYKVFYENIRSLDSAKYLLGRWNPGWYQIRMALKDSKIGVKELEALKTAHEALRAKLEPQIYTHGFILGRYHPGK